MYTADGLPPVIFALAEPSQDWQVLFDNVKSIIIGLGSFNTTVSVATQPTLSITFTMWLPAGKLDILVLWLVVWGFQYML